MILKSHAIIFLIDCSSHAFSAWWYCPKWEGRTGKIMLIMQQQLGAKSESYNKIYKFTWTFNVAHCFKKFSMEKLIFAQNLQIIKIIHNSTELIVSWNTFRLSSTVVWISCVVMTYPIINMHCHSKNKWSLWWDGYQIHLWSDSAQIWINTIPFPAKNHER